MKNDVRVMEQDIAYCVKIEQHKYSNCPNYKRKPIFSKLSKQTVNQAIKRNQSLPEKHISTNNLTVDSLALTYHPRNSSKDSRYYSRQNKVL